MDVKDYMGPAYTAGLWMTEVHRGMVGLTFKIEKTLFSERSEFQQVDVVKTEGLGAMLLNDGVVMLSERDEFIYHEMIAHVPLFVHPSPERILVIGGGDGGTVREVLKHRTVTRAVLVEIDQLVIQACREHLSSVSSAMDDPRLEILIADGVTFIDETQEIFDVVLVDSTDPVGPAGPLFDKEFYKNVAMRLAPDGILITQAASPFYDHYIQEPMFSNQRPFFKILHMYNYSNLTYPGGLWSFGFASNELCPLKNFDPARVKASGISARYYNAGVHVSSFMLPTFIAENLGDIIDPINFSYFWKNG
ncbi:MAG: polyamine aminopropyltransferase [Desulfobacterales bacterium]|nr:MAG: polyamine aminopropyltransferase [Desulfobacterales bacterium]